jgi:hypothetical protein
MSKTDINKWISKTPEALPDFIIGGAMKSGTTTLHAILNQHPAISIAHDELGFFDMDSILQHPDFNFFDSKENLWIAQDIKSNPNLYWDWYHSKFTHLEGLIKGEDSATYLASSKAAQRIASQKKPIKLIFVLRHPTERAISNYLHALKSGRAIYSLEDTLRYNPYSILTRSLYKEQLSHYYNYIPAERIKVVLFEDLISNTRACISEVCEFIGVDPIKLEDQVFKTHSNKTKLPKSISFQLARNKLFRYYGNYRYSHFLPSSPKFQKPIPVVHKALDKLHKKLNPHRSDHKFTIHESTKALLDDFFRTELIGIDELTKKTIYNKWFKN